MQFRFCMNRFLSLFLNFGSWYLLVLWRLVWWDVMMIKLRVWNMSILSYRVLWLYAWLMLHWWWTTNTWLRWHVLAMRRWRTSVHHRWITNYTWTSIHPLRHLWWSWLKLMRRSVIHWTLIWHLSLMTWTLMKTRLVH